MPAGTARQLGGRESLVRPEPQLALGDHPIELNHLLVTQPVELLSARTKSGDGIGRLQEG